MAGTLRLGPVYRSMTFRSLVIQYDSYLLDSWDHTSVLAAGIHNHHMDFIRANYQKAKVKNHSILDFHPYREGTPQHRIGKSNIKDLKIFGRIACQR